MISLLYYKLEKCTCVNHEGQQGQVQSAAPGSGQGRVPMQVESSPALKDSGVQGWKRAGSVHSQARKPNVPWAPSKAE